MIYTGTKAYIRFKIDIRKRKKLIKYLEDRNMQFIGSGCCNPLDYDYNDCDEYYVDYPNCCWFWSNDNLKKVVEDCDLGENSVFKAIYEIDYPSQYLKEEVEVY